MDDRLGTKRLQHKREELISSQFTIKTASFNDDGVTQPHSSQITAMPEFSQFQQQSCAVVLTGDPRVPSQVCFDFLGTTPVPTAVLAAPAYPAYSTRVYTGHSRPNALAHQCLPYCTTDLQQCGSSRTTHHSTLASSQTSGFVLLMNATGVFCLCTVPGGFARPLCTGASQPGVLCGH